ncbi:MAG TPA: nitrogen fixation protein NifZ [Gallionellaceae bacterium]|nr:nitrogen fixation protein NifZ [Gallionellaceae bacterium]
MAKISRDSDIVELDGPPIYDYGTKVVAKFNIRNDGTYRGKEVGEVLVKKGDVGYVSSIGTFLQQYYIYGVDFYERGTLVGMRSRELTAFIKDAESGDEHA